MRLHLQVDRLCDMSSLIGAEAPEGLREPCDASINFGTDFV